MAESNIQTLEKIFTEVDESQIKIIFSSQCIKAQAFLVDKLRKQTKYQKEICNFISSGNLKLETEIKLAEQEIKNLIISHDTIKLGNIDLRKEWLLKKTEKQDIIERIDSGEKKYEQLWLESKKRFESIPYIQKFLQIKNRSQIIQNNIKKLANESESIKSEIKIKRGVLMDLDKKLIIDVANFMVNEQPKTIKSIQNKKKEINELNAEIASLQGKDLTNNTYLPQKKSIESQQKQMVDLDISTKNTIEKNWPGSSKCENDTLLMPNLQLQTMDLDLLSVRLQQIRKVDLTGDHQKTITMIENNKNTCPRSINSDECSSSYFNKTDHDNQSKNYSNRKLIHILKDVKLEKDQTLQIISKVNINQLSDVSSIKTGLSKIQDSDTKESEAMDVDVDKESQDNKRTEVLVPPTQFSDERQYSQEKKVTFHKLEINDLKEAINVQSFISEDSYADHATDYHDIRAAVDEDNNKIKDSILNEDNLNLSQQFMYNEHTILHKMTQDQIITSKFFENKINNTDNDSSRVRKVDCHENKMESKIDVQHELNISNDCPVNKNEIISKDMLHDDRKEIPLTGFLFTHGSQGIPDSLNLSESTTGFEDIDGEYSHCIDSNILLSPKADITTEDVDDNLQTERAKNEEPRNFLTGGRKTGLSFFGWPSDSKKSSENQKSNSNFNFNFASEEKKGRGGLFNIFH